MSSGNLTADRRFAYAESLRAAGDAAAAADVIAQALELAPNWTEGHFAYAEALGAAGQHDAAVAAYRAYLELDADDSMGAAARLALLGASAAPVSLPPAYVARLFDQYAGRFDAALIEGLRYRAPLLLRDAILKAAPGRRFARAYDLGCGTGLAGSVLRERVDWLGGVDLSPAMLREAEHKSIYDHLQAGDMIAALAHLTPACDLIVAADSLVYCGDLAPVFAAAARALTPGGLFAFTVQRGEHDFSLGAEQRFSHSAEYLTRLANTVGFTVIALETAVSRQEKGQDVPGLLGVFSRSP
jgi:predicted TPR repeat methyltransferase